MLRGASDACGLREPGGFGKNGTGRGGSPHTSRGDRARGSSIPAESRTTPRPELRVTMCRDVAEIVEGWLP